LKRWQKRVNAEAWIAWTGGLVREPYPGPVGLSFWFMIHRTPREQNSPDLCNLVKGTEDALQGSVIVNDRQTRALHGEIVHVPSSEPERAFVEVWALPEPERIDPTDPHCYVYRPWEFSVLDGR
jgi:hypothetical protein